LDAKFAALNKEFDELQEKSSDLPFWNSLFWEKETVTIKEWVLVDAWYRSRCLELPRAGHAMVPGLDMANHSHAPTAYYDEDDKDNVVLLVRPGAELLAGEEVNISYGEKPSAEMLFSYGFIDSESTVEGLTLPLKVLPDDPLGKAKLHIFKGPPSLKLSRLGGEISWHSPFAYLMCLNEEDGLEFRVLQKEDGGRELKLFWQDEDVTTRADGFEDLIKDHSLCQIFRLRVVSVLHEVVSSHLMQLSSEISHEQLEPLRRAGLVRDDRLQTVEMLRGIESGVLESVAAALDEQVRLIKHDLFTKHWFFFNGFELQIFNVMSMAKPPVSFAIQEMNGMLQCTIIPSGSQNSCSSWNKGRPVGTSRTRLSIFPRFLFFTPDTLLVSPQKQAKRSSPHFGFASSITPCMLGHTPSFLSTVHIFYALFVVPFPRINKTTNKGASSARI
jgi:hypothetical protein